MRRAGGWLLSCAAVCHADIVGKDEHREFELYVDYAWSKPSKGAQTSTIFGKPVRLINAKVNRRLDAFDVLAEELTKAESRPCVNGEGYKCKAFNAYNPGIAALPDGGFWIVARLSNWSLCDWAGQGRPYNDWPKTSHPNARYEEYHSHLAALRLTKDLKAAGPAERLRLSDELLERTRAPGYEILRLGLEDPRLVATDGGVVTMVTYNRRFAGKTKTRLEANDGIVGAFQQGFLDHSVASVGTPLAAAALTAAELESDRGEAQKNWILLASGDKLYAVHKLLPMQQVLLVDPASGATSVAFENVPPRELAVIKAAVSGGSPGILVSDGAKQFYLAAAHIRRGRTQYSHFFVGFRAAPPFDIVKLSGEFCFAHKVDFIEGGLEGPGLCEGVQFVSGLERSGDRLLLTYGAQDCDARLTIMSLEKVLKLLKPVGKADAPSGKSEL